MHQDISPGTLQRLSAAEGYLELGMPEHALCELEQIGDAGPFEATRLLLTGESLKALAYYWEAIGPLHRAAELFPVLYSQPAWISLSECFRESGLDELAEVTALTAEAVEEIRASVSAEKGQGTAADPETARLSVTTEFAPADNCEGWQPAKRF